MTIEQLPAIMGTVQIIHRATGFGRSRAPADLRMFCGWAESVLWLPSGPVGYDELHLPGELAADLGRWEETWSRTAHPDRRGATFGERRLHDRRGRRLARRVADALGSEFVVELRSGLPPRRRYRGRGGALVPEAAEALRHRRRAEAAVRARIEEARRSEGDLGWSADRG